MAIQNPEIWQRGTSQWAMAEALVAHDLNRDAAWQAIVGQIGREEPLIFRTNAGDPLPMFGKGGRSQMSRAGYRMNDVLKAIQTHGWHPDGAPKPTQIEEPREEPKPEPKPKPEPTSDLQRDAAAYIRWIQSEARPFLLSRDADGDAIDEWGMRQALDGAKALKAGVPIAALKDAATMHLPEQIRTRLGVGTFDTAAFRSDERIDGFHASLPYVRRLMDGGLNIAFIGGKGTGKTTLVERLADLDGVEHTAVSCNGETGGADFYGIQRIGGDGGIIEAEFSRLLREPSYILLDELDASDENIILMLNRVLANRTFKNVLTQQEFKLHPQCRIFAGMNTLGDGATAQFGARNRLDGAALDRWAMGRVRIDLDEDLERSLFWAEING